MGLRKIGAAVAVGALLLASVIVESTPAYAAPNPPTVDQTFPDPWITDNAQPQLQGNMDATVTQIDVEMSQDGVTYSPLCTDTFAAGPTVWYCNPSAYSLSHGLNYIRATATDGTGTSAPGAPITIQVVNAPTITSPADGLITNDYQPTFSGASDGTYFTVSTTDFLTTFCNGTVVNNAWNCTATASVPDGDYTYLVETTFGATTIFSAPRTLHIDTVSPAAPTIDPFSNPVNSSPGPFVSGSGEEDATVEVLVDGLPVTCPVAPIDYTGYWSCTIGGTLSAGDHQVTAFQTDMAGNVSSASAPRLLSIQDNTPPVPPDVTSPIGTLSGGMNVVLTGSTTATVTGTGEPGATLNVVGNVCMIVPTIVDTGGNWSCQLTTPMTPDGDHDVFFSLTDTALNTSALASPGLRFTVDTTAPIAPTIDPFANPVNSSPGPVVSGTGETDATVVVLVDGFTVPCPNSVVDYYSTWSCTIGTTLSAGPHTVTATQTDVVGNTSTASLGQNLNITDNTPPAPPVVTAPIGTVIGSTNLVITNNPTPTVTGTGEPGATLLVTGASCVVMPPIVDSGGNWSCQLSPALSPDGDYVVSFDLMDPYGNISVSSGEDTQFSVDTTPPTAPIVTAPTGTLVGGVIQATTTNPHPVITGAAELGASVYIVRGGSMPVPCTGGTPVGDEGGQFTCTVAPALSPGVYYFGFSQTDRAGNSSGSPVTLLRLTITSPPEPAPPAVLPPTPLPSWVLKFFSSTADPMPGENVTFTGSDLPPGATVTAELHSTPINLGRSIVKDDGTFVLNTVIPNTVQPGAHHYVLTVTPLEGAAQSAQAPVTVMSASESVIIPPIAPVTSDHDATGSASSGNPGGAAQGANARNAPDAPNVLSNGLPTLFDIIANPLILAAAAASTLALLFLVAFPAEILNSTLDENYERIFGRLPRVRAPWLRRLRDRLKRTPVIGGLALTTLAALILSFVDPHFGFELASLRLFLACAIGMFVLGYVANVVTGFIIRRRWSITSFIELQPFGLLVALAGVILSRVLDFAPGLLIGLVLGLSLSASSSARDEVRAVLVWVAVILGLSVASWVVYSFMAGVGEPGTFADALFNDSIVAVATEGISGLVIGLLPLGFLDGRSVFRHSKWQWLGTYVAALIAFFVIVVPSGALWGGINGSFWVWLGVLLAFAAVCFGTYFWFRTHPDAEEEGDLGDRETTDETGAQVGDEAPSSKLSV